MSKQEGKVIVTDINAKQARFLKSRAKRKSFIGGRGAGKSYAMALKVKMLFELFPRATWVIAGVTYVSLDSIVVPAIRKALAACGIHEYDKKNSPFGVYVIGLMPPSNWEKPVEQPGKRLYQYCITFINGFTIRLVSQDNQETHRGLNINGIIVDESATIDFSFIQTVLIPALRGYALAPFLDHYWNYGFFDFSSASWTISGNWIYDSEKLWLEDLEDRKKKVKEFGYDYHYKNPPKVLFMESTYEDNQMFLPPDYGENQRQNLDLWKFNVEVLNQRVLELPNQYYYGLSEDNFYSNSYDYHPTDNGVLYNSNDYKASEPLYLTLDFNTDIVWVLVCQKFKNELRILESHFEKPDVTKSQKDSQEKSILIKLAEWFVKTYSHQMECKDVFIYGDPNGNSTSATTDMNNQVFFNKFCNVLIKNNLNVFRRELVRYPPRKLRYELVNLLLTGSSQNNPKIRINKNKNKSFIIAMRNTLVTKDKSFKKDKSSESKARFREEATDPTDAFDYICWSLYSKLVGTSNHRRHTGVIVK
jgi:hypothetical protein